MLRITLAVLCLLLLAVLVSFTVGGQGGHQRAYSASSSGPRSMLPARAAGMMCLPDERQCRMASYITWCCRADQRCAYDAVGGCRQLDRQR